MKHAFCCFFPVCAIALALMLASCGILTTPDADTAAPEPLPATVSAPEALPATDVQSGTAGASMPSGVSVKPAPAAFVVRNHDWINLILLCVVSLLGSWYFGASGKEDQPLAKAASELEKSLPFKKRAIFRMLRWIYRKKRKEKQNEKENRNDPGRL